MEVQLYTPQEGQISEREESVCAREKRGRRGANIYVLFNMLFDFVVYMLFDVVYFYFHILFFICVLILFIFLHVFDIAFDICLPQKKYHTPTHTQKKGSDSASTAS